MRRPGILPILSVLVLLTAVGSLALGKYHLSLQDITGFFLFKIFHLGRMDEATVEMLQNLLMEIRLPRILAALLIGASLSVSGAAFQAMFLNPLVSPGLLGVLAGASFGAALGMVFSRNWMVVQTSSFVFGFFAVIVAVGYREDAQR